MNDRDCKIEGPPQSGVTAKPRPGLAPELVDLLRLNLEMAAEPMPFDEVEEPVGC